MVPLPSTPPLPPLTTAPTPPPMARPLMAARLRPLPMGRAPRALSVAPRPSRRGASLAATSTNAIRLSSRRCSWRPTGLPAAARLGVRSPSRAWPSRAPTRLRDRPTMTISIVTSQMTRTQPMCSRTAAPPISCSPPVRQRVRAPRAAPSAPPCLMTRPRRSSLPPRAPCRRRRRLRGHVDRRHRSLTLRLVPPLPPRRCSRRLRSPPPPT